LTGQSLADRVAELRDVLQSGDFTHAAVQTRPPEVLWGCAQALSESAHAGKSGSPEALFVITTRAARAFGPDETANRIVGAIQSPSSAGWLTWLFEWIEDIEKMGFLGEANIDRIVRSGLDALTDNTTAPEVRLMLAGKLAADEILIRLSSERRSRLVSALQTARDTTPDRRLRDELDRAVRSARSVMEELTRKQP
jgi:hypothetical protein